jgi:hypothetical protein
MREIGTWGGKSSFSYSGSVETGTKFFFKSGGYLVFSSEEYKKL